VDALCHETNVYGNAEVSCFVSGFPKWFMTCALPAAPRHNSVRVLVSLLWVVSR